MFTTLCWAGGRPEPALDLITHVAASLADPPLAQLPLERSIVRAEAAQRPWSNWHNALALRYGPVAHGLGMYEEYGVTAATDQQVAEWAATRFAKGNAILYLTGPPPDDLVLRLPTGERRPSPPPKPIPYIDYPSVYPIGPEGCVVVSLVTELSAAALTAIDLGVRRLRHRLRVESGTTYHVSWVTESIDRDRVHVLITADCLPAEVDATRGLVIATLDDLAFDGPTAEELAEAADDFARFVRDPERLAHNVHYAALDELLGRSLVIFDESIDARERLTKDDVATALQRALASMLLMLPREATLPAGRFTEYPLSSPNLPKPRRRFQRRERKCSGQRRDRARSLACVQLARGVDVGDRVTDTRAGERKRLRERADHDHAVPDEIDGGLVAVLEVCLVDDERPRIRQRLQRARRIVRTAAIRQHGTRSAHFGAREPRCDAKERIRRVVGDGDVVARAGECARAEQNQVIRARAEDDVLGAHARVARDRVEQFRVPARRC